MTTSDTRVVSIVAPADQKVLSRAQKQFYTLLKKIDIEKNLLIEWQEIVPKYNQLVIEEYEVQYDKFDNLRVELLSLLDRLYENKLFKKTDKLKIRHIITTIASEIMNSSGKDALKELYDKYSDTPYDVFQQEEEQFMKSMMGDILGIDTDEDLDLTSLEDMQALFEEKLQKMDAEILEKQRQTEARQAKRKKTAKQLEKESKQLQEQQNISQSIREIYRKLTSALHPDREQDPVEKARKTEIMQRVNAAYAKKDLLGLLELQLEVEQIDQDHLLTISDVRIRYFNKILKEQLEELQYEIWTIEAPFKMKMNLPPFVTLLPKEIITRLRNDVKEVKRDISMLKRDIQILSDPVSLKAWLKTYKIPVKKQIYNDLDDLFMRDFPRGF